MEYNMRKSFPEKQYSKYGGVLDPFTNKSELSISPDQDSEMFYILLLKL